MRTRVAVAGLGTAFLLVLFAGYRVYVAGRDAAAEQFEAAELRSADDVAGLLERELEHAATTVAALADTLAESSDARAIDPVIARQNGCDAFPCFTGVAVFAGDGTPRRSAGAALDVTQPLLTSALDWARDGGGRIRFVVPAPDPPSVVLLAALPHAAAGPADRPILVAARLALGPFLAARLRSSRAAWPGYQALVVAGDGSIVFQSSHPEKGVANVRARTDRCFTCHDSLDHVEHMLVSKRGILRYRLRAVEQVAAVAPLKAGDARWVVGIRTPRTRVAGTPVAEARTLALLSALGLAIAVSAVALVWRRDRRRVAQTTAAVHQERRDQDVQELQATVSMLERVAHEWRAAADTIDAAFIVLEPNGVIVRMNLAAAATLPEGLAAWLGRPSSRLADYSPWNMALPLVDEAIEHQMVSTDRVRVSGQTWDLWCRALPPERTPPAVLLMARDVTAVVDLQESLRRSETMAQLGSIVSGVAHEVRNPLFAISSLVDAWAVQSHRDPRPFVDALRSEVNRLRTLMVDLLEYGRPAKTTRQMQRLAGVVDGAIHACTHEATAREVRVIISAFPDVEVIMDSRGLERVFINLVQNAIQHAPASSEVRIDASVPPADPNSIAITVRDSGPGFSPEDLPRVFTPFFSRRPGGFGLGLAITERIVTEHGGRVTAANDPAGGAVMTVTLPIARARASGQGPNHQVQRV